MTPIDFDLTKYVAARRTAEPGRTHGGAAYAYPGDHKVLRALERVKPVTLATAATVRLWKSVAKSEILGRAVKVTERQFPQIHRVVSACAARLEIAEPAVYIAPEVGALNAHTFGTDDDAYIVLNGVLVDHLSDEELTFVIGHECGHVQNNHVVYTTALYYLMYSASFFLRWIVKPAVVALQGWARRAEITCDRAGLICCGDLDTALRALVKIALGSKRLAEQVNLDEYLKQLDEGRREAGRVMELFDSHPYLPKRAEALRLFGESHYFLKSIDQAESDGVGRSLDWCDAEVSRLISIFGSRTPRDPAANGPPPKE